MTLIKPQSMEGLVKPDPTATTSSTAAAAPEPTTTTTGEELMCKPEDLYSQGSAPTQTSRDRLSVGYGLAPGEVTDPELAATISAERARMGRGVGARDDGRGLNGAGQSLRSGTGRIPRADWDNPERIVGKLTQYPARGALTANNAQDRCAPSNLLGGAIMAGPNQAKRFLDNAAANPRLSAAEKAEMRGIATAVGNRTATFEQLSRAQGLLYKAGNTRGDFAEAMTRAESSPALTRAEKARVHALYDRVVVNNGGLTEPERADLTRLLTKAHGSPTEVKLLEDPQHPGDQDRMFWGVSVRNDHSGYDDAEISGLVAAGGGSPRQVALEHDAMHPLESALNGLGNGESITMRVSGTDEGTDADHFVTVGKRSDGTPYVYNPDPARGDYTLFTGSSGGSQPQGFLDELHKYEGRMAVDNDGDTPHAIANRW